MNMDDTVMKKQLCSVYYVHSKTDKIGLQTFKILRIEGQYKIPHDKWTLLKIPIYLQDVYNLDD